MDTKNPNLFYLEPVSKNTTTLTLQIDFRSRSRSANPSRLHELAYREAVVVEIIGILLKHGGLILYQSESRIVSHWGYCHAGRRASDMIQIKTEIARAQAQMNQTMHKKGFPCLLTVREVVAV